MCDTVCPDCGLTNHAHRGHDVLMCNHCRLLFASGQPTKALRRSLSIAADALAGIESMAGVCAWDMRDLDMAALAGRALRRIREASA